MKLIEVHDPDGIGVVAQLQQEDFKLSVGYADAATGIYWKCSDFESDPSSLGSTKSSQPSLPKRLALVVQCWQQLQASSVSRSRLRQRRHLIAY
jgi:hypothetical protein